MSKQTAVEWLVEQLKKQGFLYDLDIDQALAMEREQIEEAYNNGQQVPPFEFAKQYYDETYGKEATDANG